MKSVALVTYSNRSELSNSDQTLLEPLKQRGINPIPAIWNDTAVNWQQFDAVVIRSTWDYYQHVEEFRQWLTQLKALDVPVYNSVDTILWNMEKTYLRDLEAQGVKIVPTIWCETVIDLGETMQNQSWDAIVMKPVFGASGVGIQMVTTDDMQEKQSVFEFMLQTSMVMIQPVIKEIQDGELSLVFFQNEYAYTIRKKPGDGTIFVNSAYGGRNIPTEVDDETIKVAQSVLKIAHEITGQASFLYTRVDGVMVDGEFVLMELELIEPGLFMDIVSFAPERFADAINLML